MKWIPRPLVLNKAREALPAVCHGSFGYSNTKSKANIFFTKYLLSPYRMTLLDNLRGIWIVPQQQALSSTVPLALRPCVVEVTLSVEVAKCLGHFQSPCQLFQQPLFKGCHGVDFPYRPPQLANYFSAFGRSL